MSPKSALLENVPAAGSLAADTPSQKITYLWPGWLVENQVNVISGPQGVNKSTFAMFIAAQLSHGKTPENKMLPAGGPSDGNRRTLYYGLEDTPQVIMERCQWFGANLGKIRIVDTHIVDGIETAPSFDAAKYIENDIIQFRPRLMVFDVFRAAFGSLNIQEAKHVNKVFALMREWNQKYKVTILLIHHSKQNPITREDCLEGSIALRRAVRSAAYISKFDPEGANCRIIAPYKMSWSKEPDPLHFWISSAGPNDAEMRMAMGDKCGFNVDEILSLQSKYAREKAKKRLKELGVSEELADE